MSREVPLSSVNRITKLDSANDGDREDSRLVVDDAGADGADMTTDGGRSILARGYAVRLGLYLSDRVLESKLLSRDDRLAERRIDCFQFIHESVSATFVERPAILSVPQAHDSLRD